MKRRQEEKRRTHAYAAPEKLKHNVFLHLAPSVRRDQMSHLFTPNSSIPMLPPTAMHVPHMLISLILPRPEALLSPLPVSRTVMHITEVLFLLNTRDMLRIVMASEIRDSAEAFGGTGWVVAGELLGVGEDVAYDLVFVVGGRSGRGWR
jgi:hypothetical protein